ncbi:hypothetical protein C368_03155 [Cryptococcus neoformans 125.91]|nr:hypothetical protein C368_03155 [Cryptococcus neoformans var. grubii 125.91]
MDLDLKDVGFSFAKPDYAPKNPFESIRSMKPFLPSSSNATGNNYTNPPVRNTGSNSPLSATTIAARPHGMFPSFRFQNAHPLSQSILPQKSPSSSSASTETATNDSPGAVAASNSPSATTSEMPNVKSKVTAPQLPFGVPGRRFLPNESAPFQAPTSSQTPFVSNSFNLAQTNPTPERQSNSSLFSSFSTPNPAGQGNQIMNGANIHKETMTTESPHRHNRGWAELPMKDRARDEERFHLEALEEDKEDTMEFEDRPTYEQDNEDGMLEMEKREAYESTIRQEQMEEYRRNAYNMDRREERMVVETGQQSYSSQENNGRDVKNPCRHELYQEESHEALYPESVPSQAADSDLQSCRRDSRNSSERLGLDSSLLPAQGHCHTKHSSCKTPDRPPPSSGVCSLSNSELVPGSMSFLQGVSNHDISGCATATFKPSDPSLIKQQQKKDNGVDQNGSTLPKTAAGLRVELEKGGSSEQMLLMMLQAKNGEIDNLKDGMLRLQELVRTKQSLNDDLIQESKRLGDIYKQSEQIWKTSISNAKRWRDTIKQKEMSKNQALKELKDGYDEHSHTYSETLASLSKELVTFREESMTKTKEDLEVHSSALAKIRTALQSVKEDVTSHGNAVEDLQNTKSLNVRLEDEMKAKNEELSLARNQILELQNKLKTFEETLAPNLERMMDDMIQLKESASTNPQTLEAALLAQKELHEKLSEKEKENVTLQRESQEIRFSRDNLDSQLREAAKYFHALGCETKDLKDMMQELERKHKEALQESVAKTEAAENEWKHKLELADTRVTSLEKSLSSIKADAHSFAQRAVQTEMDLKADFSARSSESQARIHSIEKELNVAVSQRDKMIRSLDETRAREQTLKDKITGLTQSTKESQLQLQGSQASLQDARKQGHILEEQVKSLSKQLESRSQKSESTMKFDDHFKHLQVTLEELRSAQGNALELERAKAEVIHKQSCIQDLQKSLNDSCSTVQDINNDIRRLRLTIDQVTEENGRLKVEIEGRGQSGKGLVERWEKDELNVEEVVLVQKITQQIRRGEQAICRQELDEKSNAVKRLESRCKKLEAQISALSHGRMTSSLTTPSALSRITYEAASLFSSPLSNPPTSSTAASHIQTVHSSSDSHNRPSTKSASSPLAAVAVLRKPNVGSATNFVSTTKPNSTAANGKKRRLLDSQDVEDNEESFGHGEVIDEKFANVDEALLDHPSLTQVPVKPQKKTRFAEISEHSSPSPDSQPEDADDPIDPPTSQPQLNLRQLAPPPPSQVTKTYARNKGAMRARSSLENVMTNSDNASGTTGHEKGNRKLRGGRKSY